jgi:hypothetical protein
MNDNEKAIEACKTGNLSIIQNMNINGIKLDQSVLEAAAQYGRYEVVVYLVEKCGLKALANEREAMKRATNEGFVKIFLYLQKRGFAEATSIPIVPIIPVMPVIPNSLPLSSSLVVKSEPELEIIPDPIIPKPALDPQPEPDITKLD